MLTCRGLNLVRSIFSSLAAVKNFNVNLSCAKFSSSVVNIKICHNLQPIRGGLLFESYNKFICCSVRSDVFMLYIFIYWLTFAVRWWNHASFTEDRYLNWYHFFIGSFRLQMKYLHCISLIVDIALPGQSPHNVAVTFYSMLG